MDNHSLFLMFATSTILNLGLAIFGLRQRHLQGAVAFSLAMFLFALLPLAQAVSENSPGLAIKVIALKSRVETAGIGATAWLVMMMQLTGFSHLVNRRLILALSIAPLLFLVLNWMESPCSAQAITWTPLECYIGIQVPFSGLAWGISIFCSLHPYICFGVLTVTSRISRLNKLLP